jgi:hypothetical protein
MAHCAQLIPCIFDDIHQLKSCFVAINVGEVADASRGSLNLEEFAAFVRVFLFSPGPVY